MGIGIYHAHNNNGKYARYVGVCWPQGPTFKYKRHIVSLLSNQGRHWLWFGMVIGIGDPHTHNGYYRPTQYVEGCRPQGPIFIKGLLFLSN